MPRIVIIPGRNQHWKSGIGSFLQSQNHIPTGVSLGKEFLKLEIQSQLNIITQKINNYWNHKTILVGKSYGAYLLIHSLLNLPAFPGKIILFSPVLGKAFIENNGQFFCSIPPRSKKILQAIDSKSFPPPTHIEIHTGEKDNGCDPSLTQNFTESIPGATLNILPDEGHSLNHAYENKTLLNLIEST